MDYFSKLSRHIAAPRKPPPQPASQLARFERAWKAIQSHPKPPATPVDSTPLPAHLLTIFDLLVQEDIHQSDLDDATTGACMEFLLANSILDDLVTLAEADRPPGLRGVVIRNLSTFVSLTDDKLLVQKAVHNPILELLRSYSLQRASAKADIAQSVVSIFNSSHHMYDDDFVDLMYAICSKIRGEPMLLNIFFQDKKWLKAIELHQQHHSASSSSDSIAAMMRSVESLHSLHVNAATPLASPSPPPAYEFLLFSHLLQFVHLEGKAGDTARTSLLFLLELATTEIMASTGGNSALERFIIEDSGFAAILSATLGAMYSQLPRCLQVSTGPTAVVPESFPSYSADLQNAIESSIFTAPAAADRASIDRWPETQGLVTSANPEFRARLASFANVLGFIQEVLFRCPSPHVCDQLLRNLRDNYLHAILYPSLLESSDTDGSSVAVMRYLETMLQCARHEDLVGVIMGFLTDDSADAISANTAPADDAAAADAPAAAPCHRQQTAESACLPFTLRDLVYSNLQSSVSTDAVVSALNLLRLVLTKHCRYSSRLIEVERVQASASKNGWMTNCTVAIDVHRQELDMYAKLMAQLQTDSSCAASVAASKRDVMDTDSQTLHIPWRRQQTLPRGFALNADRQKLEARAAVPESFLLGYDEYLEDAALEWDAHQAYHAELDALFVAQSARSAMLKNPSRLSPPPPSLVTACARQEKQRKMRPRKYSEAVSALVGDRKPGTEAAVSTHALLDYKSTLTSASLSKQNAGSIDCCTDAMPVLPRPPKHAKHNIKQSDPIVRALMHLLTKYFAQPRECNLALTGVLAALVGCPHRTLDLWLGFNIPTLLAGVLSKPWSIWLDNLRNISDDERGSNDSDSEGEDDPRNARKPRGAPAAAIANADASKYVGLDHELQMAVRALPSGATPPSLYLVVSGLVQQAMVLQNEIPDFSRRLKRARNALMGIVEDVDDLDDELENNGGSSLREAYVISDTRRTRDRGLSSASLDNARALADSVLLGGPSAAMAGKLNRNRSSSGATATKDAVSQNAAALKPPGARARTGSVGHAADPSPSSASTATNGKPVSLTSPASDALPASPACHSLSVPPANANLAEFLENVIILQESIKEIIARVQVRRENGGDKDAVS
ncbi:hypothetical protein GGI02_002362 [Coemansia sp. RSA 2322]|nr:hypothetical protein GGI02_002362 [Coemansia sp. RSA 2322]